MAGLNAPPTEATEATEATDAKGAAHPTDAPPAGAAAGDRRRHRISLRHVGALVLAVWVVAGLLPLAWQLPSAISVGAAQSRLRADLGSGWSKPVSRTVGGRQVVEALSTAAVSTLVAQPTWRAVDLDLAPVSCPSGAPQQVFVHGGSTATSKAIVLAPGFHWYKVDLGGPVRADELRLSYGCLVGVIRPGVSTPLNAVALAGLSGTS